MCIVERTCTLVSDSSGQTESKPLGEYRDTPAYVLLGGPGSGKTTAFRQESDNREDAVFVSARDMVTFDAGKHPEWQNKILFIDGLDEIRAGSPDFRTPFDRIRAALDKLGCPRFRISCREADWLGPLDRGYLKTVSPDSKVLTLHLDPLTEDDIKHILSDRLNETDTGSFIRKAKEHGLEQLLDNPLTLDLLTKAATGGEWPDTRKKAFEQACRILPQEHNREHVAEHAAGAGAQIVNLDQLLDTAGYLSAIQLMAGNAGYALSIVAQADEFPSIEEIDHNNPSLLKKATQTRLFKHCGEDRVEPIHRHVAEYLAARYLSRRIDQEGLPLGRVLALMTGEDGFVVSGLRGLSAWLAVFCINHRKTIVDCDPLGVVLYGDVRPFNHDDKLYLLNALHDEARKYPWFRIPHWNFFSFGGIATPDMEDEFRSILTSSDRSPADQEFALCVLNAMLHGDRMSDLDDVLVDIVRSADWWSSVRYGALEAICRSDEAGHENVSRMKLLLDEINRGVVRDPNERLMGFLLTRLYPQFVTPETVFDYFHAPADPGFSGDYVVFWSQILYQRSSDEDIKTLLDQLASRHDIPNLISGNFPGFKDSISRLLQRGLEVHGTSIEPNRLYEWMGIGLEEYGPGPDSGIVLWLEAHPEIQKNLMIIGESNCQENQYFGHCMYRTRERLRLARLPDDYGRWCLDRLAMSPNDDIARYWVQEAVNSIMPNEGSTGLSLEEIQRAVENNKQHQALLEKMLYCPIDDDKQAFRLSRYRQEYQKRKKRRKWLEHVKSQEHSLREGKVHPRLLHDLASAYFGFHLDIEGEPSQQLLNLLDRDENLVEYALEGLRRSIDRNDAPDVEEIFRLAAKNEEHLLGRAWLAGMVENTRLCPDFALRLSEGQFRKALAFYLTGNIGGDEVWFERSLESRPEAIAETLIHYVSVTLARKSWNISIARHLLYKLSFEPEYGSVAGQVMPVMLKSFPARCNTEQLELLHAMLISAVKYLDRDALRAQIEDKLNLSSMNASQRICWLVTGLAVAPEFFEERLAEFMGGNESRARHLSRFLSFERGWLPLESLPVSVVRLLVEILGRYFAPYSWKGCVQKTSAMFTAEIVERMINLLASDAGLEAVEALVSLSKNRHLEKWRSRILDARFWQRTVRREACFRHPDTNQVVSTLKNSCPANAGDLAALVCDILDEMANRIRHGNTDDYNQFWNEAKHGQPAVPKHEDLCKDALLSDLRPRLGLYQIDAQPEGHYAQDKRADIRISSGGPNGPAIPVEIKKNCHRDLWKAIHSQLMRYAGDDHADGYGIYLVFWFGSDRTKISPQGSRPATPQELTDMLTESLTNEEKGKILVRVIDVSLPHPRKYNDNNHRNRPATPESLVSNSRDLAEIVQ